MAYVVSDHLYDTDGREQSALGVGSWAWKSGSMAIMDFVRPRVGASANDSCVNLRLCPKPLEVEQEMNHDQWIESAEALLHLDEKKALVPHGIGGHSRTLLEEAITLLRAHNSDSAEPVAWSLVWNGGYGVNADTTFKHKDRAEEYAMKCGEPKPRVVPLYLASPPAKEVIDDGRWKRIYDALAKEGGATWATYMMIDIEALTNRTPDDEVGNED